MKHKTDIFPIGKITFTSENGKITSIEVTDEEYSDNDAVLDTAISQMHEYFNGERKIFDFDIGYVASTEFYRKVWNLLRTIPYGETLTYGELAKKAGCPKGARAVGNAVHNNPLLIVNPCHRVVAANGKIGGFSYGVSMKNELLMLEEKFK